MYLESLEKHAAEKRKRQEGLIRRCKPLGQAKTCLESNACILSLADAQMVHLETKLSLEKGRDSSLADQSNRYNWES
jgi:hypothetical protein